MATNGTITKKILKACKTQTGETLRSSVAILLRSFPLSSYKLVYNSDQSKVPAEAWTILIEECVKSDAKKLESLNEHFVPMGADPTTTFGRYTPS